MENEFKHVDFHKYCPDCKYYKQYHGDDPCNSCLNEPARQNSHKPEYFDPKKGDIKL